LFLASPPLPYFVQVRDYIREVGYPRSIPDKLVRSVLVSFGERINLRLHLIIRDLRSTFGELVRDPWASPVKYVSLRLYKRMKGFEINPW